MPSTPEDANMVSPKEIAANAPSPVASRSTATELRESSSSILIGEDVRVLTIGPLVAYVMP